MLYDMYESFTYILAYMYCKQTAVLCYNTAASLIQDTTDRK